MLGLQKYAKSHAENVGHVKKIQAPIQFQENEKMRERMAFLPLQYLFALNHDYLNLNSLGTHKILSIFVTSVRKLPRIFV